MQIQPKTRHYLVTLVIVIYWVRGILLNTVFQSETEQLASSTDQLFRTATLYGAINLVVLLFFWYWSGGNLKMLGWKREGFWKHLGIGTLFGLGMIIQSYFISGPVIGQFIPPTANPGVDVGNLLSDWSDLPFWILLAIFKGGFEEELWRSFEINAFSRIGNKAGLIFGLVVGAFVFGMQHSYQGVDTIVGTAFDGLLYGLIYLRKRSVVEAMTAHAVYDIISILAGYLLS